MADKLLDNKTEQELWQTYKKTKDAKIRDFFIKQ